MSEILSVAGNDFCVLGSFDVPLLKRGLTLITGSNQDTEAASSNGSGKTTIFKALAWGLYERAPDGAKADEIIRRGADSAFVETRIRRGGEDWSVRRIRRKGRRSVSLHDAAGVKRMDGADVDAWIEEALGLDFQAFCSTVLYTPGGKRFGDPDATDGDRKSLLHRVLNTGPLQACAKAARDAASGLRDKVEQAMALSDAAKREADRAEAERKEAAAKGEAFKHEQIEIARGFDDRADTLIAKAKLAAATGAKMDADVKAAREKLDAAQAVERLKMSTREAVAARLAHARIALDLALRVCDDAVDAADKFAAGKCPECGTAVDAGDRRTHAEHEAAKAEIAQAAFVKVNAEAMTAKKEHTAAVDAVAAAQRAERETAGKAAAATGAAATAESMREEAASLRERAAAARTAESPWGKVTESAYLRREAAQARATRAAGLVATASRECAHAEFWARGFGQEGLPALMLDEAIPEMEESANRYLGILADGDIVFRATPSSATKAGDARERIGVSWSIEGVDDATPSTGQRRKMEIATGLALMDIACARSGACPDLLLMDEALDGLDVEGRSRVVRLLRSLRSRRGSILVVTHEAAMSEAFEQVISVTKESGVARVDVVK